VKKILISILIIGVVAAIAIGGTTAWFTSQQQYDNNQITAATYNVGVGSGSMTLPMSVTGLAPGEMRDAGIIKIVNDGQLAAWMRAYTSITGGTDGFSSYIKVKLTLLDTTYGAYNGYQPYPGTGGPYISWDGALNGLHFGNVGHNNPIQPGQMGVYKVEVGLDGSTPVAYQSATCLFSLVFESQQSGFGAPVPAWP
jgi:predicted ribosomally synthesized peptide with SipW-like signal peptide